MMTRQQLLLAILATAQGRSYTPVQIQKAAFLLTRNIPDAVTEGPNFHFVPYDYGPFNSDVYEEASSLAAAGLAVIAPSGMGRWHTYAATQEGVARGQEVLRHMDERTRQYISRITDWVRGQGFGSLVRSIYEAYPEMRANSIFQG